VLVFLHGLRGGLGHGDGDGEVRDLAFPGLRGDALRDVRAVDTQPARVRAPARGGCDEAASPLGVAAVHRTGKRRRVGRVPDSLNPTGPEVADGPWRANTAKGRLVVL